MKASQERVLRELCQDENFHANQRKAGNSMPRITPIEDRVLYAQDYLDEARRFIARAIATAPKTEFGLVLSPELLSGIQTAIENGQDVLENGI